jgi:hypothetical protein
VGPRVGLDGCGKSPPPPNGIRSPDRPARSESLYRLIHRGPRCGVESVIGVCRIMFVGCTAAKFHENPLRGFCNLCIGVETV